MATDESWGPSLCKAAAPEPSTANAVEGEGATPESPVSHLQRELRTMHTKMREQSLYIALQEKQMEVIQRENNELRQTSLRSGSDLAKSTAKTSDLQKALNAHIHLAEKRESHMKRLKAQVMELEMAHAEAQQELERLRQRRGPSKQESSSTAATAQASNAQKGKKGQQTKKQRQRHEETKPTKKNAPPAQKKKAERPEKATESATATSEPVRQPSQPKKATKPQKNATKGQKKAGNEAKSNLTKSQAAVAVSAQSQPSKAATKSARKQKKKPSQPPAVEEPIDGVAGFMVGMLTPGVQSDAISVLNWVPFA